LLSRIEEVARDTIGNGFGFALEPLQCIPAQAIVVALQCDLREGDAIFIHTGWEGPFLNRDNYSTSIVSIMPAWNAPERA
jgi:hypothetical protein